MSHEYSDAHDTPILTVVPLVCATISSAALEWGWGLCEKSDFPVATHHMMPTDACDNRISHSGLCGSGTVGAAEECDDGNTAPAPTPDNDVSEDDTDSSSDDESMPPLECDDTDSNSDDESMPPRDMPLECDSDTYSSSDDEGITQQWRGGQLLCIVATVAFGMGIDTPNVRLVVHWGAPLSITESSSTRY